MNFQGKAVLVYLEEDNIARAYFRVKPLMTQDGPLDGLVSEYPDDGFLRIVPDKNEQHTFKERMRSMIGLCLVDLRLFPMDANKIRTNKNYSPARGETNQYIVYSDAVRALPDHLVYQVCAQGDIQHAVTPQVYIRNGANIQGPFRREDGQTIGDTLQLPPDSAEIHALSLNGQDMLFYWPHAAESPAPVVRRQPEEVANPEAADPLPKELPVLDSAAPAAAAEPSPVDAYEQIQTLNEPVSEKANRLDYSSAPAVPDFAAAQNAKPLTGTKLYQAPQRQMAPRRAHNSLMEAVENQRYASRFDNGRYETRYEAPGATLPQNTELREVANPADALKRALQNMSHSPETQRQAADVILNQSGMRIMLSKALAHETNDLTLAAMHSQLQELEAERLMTLMQLDDAKKNVSSLHEEAVAKLNFAEQKKLDQLHIAQQTAQNALDQLNKAMEPLEKKRQEAAEQLKDMQGILENHPHFLCPPAGATATKEELISRVEAALKAAGFEMEAGDAQAMLIAFSLCLEEEGFEIRSETCDDAWLGLKAFAAALGTQAVEFQSDWDAVVVPGGNTPVFVQAGCTEHPLITNVSLEELGAANEYNDKWFIPYASIPLYPAQDAIPQPLPAYPAVCKECVLRQMLTDMPLSDETKAVIASLRKELANLGKPLPLRSVGLMSRFIAAAQNDLKGGVAEAIDRACCLYVAQHILDFGLDKESIKPLLSAMPRTLKALRASNE